jgi:hypothetical protein
LSKPWKKSTVLTKRRKESLHGKGASFLDSLFADPSLTVPRLLKDEEVFLEAKRESEKMTEKLHWGYF